MTAEPTHYGMYRVPSDVRGPLDSVSELQRQSVVLVDEPFRKILKALGNAGLDLFEEGIRVGPDCRGKLRSFGGRRQNDAGNSGQRGDELIGIDSEVLG